MPSNESIAERALKGALIRRYPELARNAAAMDCIAAALERAAPGLGLAIHEREASASFFEGPDTFDTNAQGTMNGAHQITFFKSGAHIAGDGVGRYFSDGMLRAAAEAYNPSVHEAPLVLGHPATDEPSYGWVRSITFSNGTLTANVAPSTTLVDMVRAGAYKKVSASWYLPNSLSNPKPGQLYLKHIGFLGAMPPAIKGLPSVQFADSQFGAADFSGAGASRINPLDHLVVQGKLNPACVPAVRDVIEALHA
jgi:hypothetical protein